MASSLYHVDSKYREEGGTPGSYTYPLDKQLRHVTNIEVVYGEIPSSSFSFKVGDSGSEWGFGRDRTNTIHVTLTFGTVWPAPVTYERFIRLTPGMYTGPEFAEQIQDSLNVEWNPNALGINSLPRSNRDIDENFGCGAGFFTATYNEATNRISITRGLNAVNLSLGPGNTKFVTGFVFNSIPPSIGIVAYENLDVLPGMTLQATQSVEIMSAPIAFLVIKNVKFRRANNLPNNSGIPSAGRGQLARFQLTAQFGYMNYFSTEHLLEHGEVEEPCSTNIDHLEIEWINRDGNVMDFNGLNHTLQLRISHS
jgi:hypothetical protein